MFAGRSSFKACVENRLIPCSVNAHSQRLWPIPAPATLTGVSGQNASGFEIVQVALEIYFGSVELRHLRYFVAVGEALSFTKGARTLHISQPSLTRQIKDLEEEVGVRLLDRNKQSVSLTRQGAAFLTDAKRILSLSRDIVDSARRPSDVPPTPLNIGYVADLFYDLLPVTLKAFQRSFPTIPINLFDMSCGDQFHALEEGRIDLGFVGLRAPIAERGLEFLPIASYPTVAALAKNHPLAKEAIVLLKKLKPMFFIGMSEDTYPGYRRWLTETCRKVGFGPKVLQDMEIERTLIQAVAAGLGVALLPEQVRNLPHASVVFRKLHPSVRTESCIAWKGDNPSAALRAYVEIVGDRGRRMR
jgi:DNA-binding transcriptional LysR family regulator